MNLVFLLIFSTIVIAFSLYSLKLYNKFINPLLIYSAVWFIPVLLHQIGFINYNKLENYTWFIIILVYLLFAITSVLSYKNVKESPLKKFDEGKYKANLKKMILIVFLITSIAVIGDFYFLLEHYGIEAITNISKVYYERVNNIVVLKSIPYLSSFIYILFVLLGIYQKKYGFTFFTLLGVFLVMLSAFTSGARMGIVFNLVLFIFAFLLTNKNKDNNKSKSNLVRYTSAIAILIPLFIIFIYINRERSSGQELAYITPLYTKIFGENSSIYKILVYITAPIGTLNEFLKDPTFLFGHNTFLSVYNLLAKIGLISRIDQYQKFYNTPIPCNVGTWIRELYEDFTVIGMVFFVVLFTFIVNYFYKKSKNNNCTGSMICISVFLLVITMSFFDWKLRSFGLWIALFFGFLIGKYIDKKSIIK